MSKLNGYFVAMLAAALLATGCSPAGEAAPPTRTFSTTRTSTPISRPSVVPPVVRSLDLASYRSRPCDLLKPDQQAPFDHPGLANRELISYCTWTKEQTKSQLNVLLVINGDHFKEIFKEDYYRKWLIFEPRTIGEQPAAVVSDSRDPRYCDVVVATGPKDAIEVSQDSGVVDEDACVRAVEWAERIVHNLGG